MASSIISQLGYGSGVDTAQLVSQLAAAARAPKEAQIKVREERNTASVSALANVSNGIDAFASSLKALIDGGSVSTQPTSSDAGIVQTKALAGARLGNLSAQLEVRQLAQAQTVSSAGTSGRDDAVGTGTLTITVGGVAKTVTIGSDNATLAGVAAAINASSGGVTASVVQGGAGYRLVVKGATGAANAFSIDAAPDAGGSPAVPLSTLAYPGGGGGMTLAQSAADAIVRLDGVELSRPTNTVADILPGVSLTLRKAAPGTLVDIGAERPTAGLTTAIGDFVAAFNEMKTLVDAATKPAGSDGKGAGALRGDVGMREMQRRLAQLTLTPLTAETSGPRTLAEIGVSTNRDGSLSLDAAKLARAVAEAPDAVEAMFNPGQRSSSAFLAVTSALGASAPGTYTLTDIVPANGPTPASGKLNGVAMIASGNSLRAPSGSAARGLSVEASAPIASATVTVDMGLGGALQAIRDALRAGAGPLATTSARLGKEATLIGRDREALESRSAAYTQQLTAQFTAMERRVAAFKATQSYLEQQVALWTKDK